jgi:hypothetical protein
MDGSRHSLYMIQESTYGVTPTSTPAFVHVRNTGTTLALTKNTTESAEIRSDRQISDSRHGARKIGGDLSIELSYGSFDAILEAVLCGTWATDSPVAGTDRLKAGTTRRSFTLERIFADASDKPYHRFTGVEFDSLQLQVNADAMVKGTLKVIGQDLSLNAASMTGASYGAASTTSPLDSFTGVIKEGGSTVAVVTEVQLTLENALASRFVVGSKTSLSPSIGRSKVSGQVGVYFETVTMLEKFINETESSMEFTLPDGVGNSLKITIPRVKYNGGQPDVKGEGPIMLTMPFIGLLDTTTSTNLIIDRTLHIA